MSVEPAVPGSVELGRGPWVVALGGGHGLSMTLAAVRRYAGRVTAVVSVADDGGSSGRLRRSFGIAAPGDVRRCLVALSDPDSVWGQAFEYRFADGELGGHALGNLVIAGLAAVTGDFAAALAEAGSLLGVTGRVLPATSVPVVLEAEVAGRTVVGQVNVAEAGGRITRIGYDPSDPPVPDEVVEAITAADQVVIGPGSLYTSVLASAAVPGVRRALAARSGGIVYVCNLRPQEGETEGLSAVGHVQALADHGIEPDAVLLDPGATLPDPSCDIGPGDPASGVAPGGDPPPAGGARAAGAPGSCRQEDRVNRVPAGGARGATARPRPVTAATARDDGLAHDPARLAVALRDLLGADWNGERSID